MYPFILYRNDDGLTLFGNVSNGDIGIISSYGLMLMLAFLMCNYLLKKHIISIDKDPRVADDIIFYAAIGGIFGSKIYHIIEYVYLNGYNAYLTNFIYNISSLSDFISWFGSGLVFLGGLIGGLILVTLYIKYKTNYKWLIVSDWVGPYLILGHAIGRIGCFLVGDCYGMETNIPWGMEFPVGSPPTINGPVHPTQIYEFISGLCIFFYLIYIRKNHHLYKGQIFFEYMFLAGLARFLVEFIRVNDIILYIGGEGLFTGAQIISLIMILISSICMYYFRAKNKITY